MKLMAFPAVRVAVVALTACLAGWAAPCAGQPADTAFESAVHEHQRGNWAGAYGLFLELANEGDADAARIVLFMYRYGPILYKSYWDAAPDDAQYWHNLAHSGAGRKQRVFRAPESSRSSREEVRGRGRPRAPVRPTVNAPQSLAR